MQDRFFINMPIPADKYEAVCAVLAGVSTVALAATGAGAPGPDANRNEPAASPEKPSPTAAAPTGAGEQSQASGGAEASLPAGDPNEIDAHGHPWNPELHAGTKGKTKDGLWRMKVGVTRPDPLPGFPKEGASSEAGSGTGTSTGTGTNSATSQGATGQGAGQPATSAEEEDEFAAFREAAAASDATDQAAAAAATAAKREFTDADLGALCNQAAVKLGDPAPIKEIIAKYVPEGQVQHSRNIPADKRDDFAKEVEAKAGIEFSA